jgi:hypothetical protein
LVEVFRKGDLVDFSIGLIKSGLPGSLVKEVKAAIPNAGFHRFLLNCVFCAHSATHSAPIRPLIPR